MAIEFTDEQKEIISHPVEKNGRVIAGPGTGKSLTAVELTNRLINSEDNPAKVKFITFTRAATAELATKLENIESEKLAKPSTLHSFSISVVLQNEGCAEFPVPLRIPNDVEKRLLIRRHLAKLVGVKVKLLDNLIKEMAAKWESLSEQENTEISTQERAKFMGIWLVHRSIFGYTLLEELPDLLRCALRDHDHLKGIDYDIIIVDEYQDLNACDLEVLRRLSDREISIFAIGDDKQSIYSFRNAHPKGILRFPNEFTPIKDYGLTICRRLPRKLFEWSQFVIQGSTDEQSPYTLDCYEQSDEGHVGLLRFRNEEEEAKGVSKLTKWMINSQHIDPSDILILSRKDRQGIFTKLIKDNLEELNIPFSETDKINIILEDQSNRYVIEILSLLSNEKDSLAWWSLMEMTKGIGAKFISFLYQKAKEAQISFSQAFFDEATNNFSSSPIHGKKQAKKLWESMTNFIELTQVPDDEDIYWGKWILEQMENGQLPECTDDLKQLLIEIDDLIDKGKNLGFYIGQIQPIGKDILSSHSHGVRLMRMRQSKGLTVRATIVIGAENDLIPFPQEDFDEERRLLYVAMTRSTEMLFMTWAKQRSGPTAHSGRPNHGLRQHTSMLRGGPVESIDGEQFVRNLC